MARRLSVAAAKAQFSEVLREVSKGEVVVVQRRGSPVAVIRAYEPQDGNPEKSWLEDIWGVAADLPEFDKIMQKVVASRSSGKLREIDLDS